MGLVTGNMPGRPLDGSGAGGRNPDPQNGRGRDRGRVYAWGAWVGGRVKEETQYQNQG